MLRSFKLITSTLLLNFMLTGCAYIRGVLVDSGKLLGISCNTSSIDGSGTLADPYILCNEAQVLTMSGAANGVYYKLGKDIELSSAFDPITGFLGVFDGDQHTISGLKINQPNSSYQGFFSSLENGAVVSDVVFDGANITASSYAGVLAGVINSSWSAQVQVSGVTVKNSFLSVAYNAGAIAGGAAVATLSDIKVSNTTIVGINSLGIAIGSGDGNLDVNNAEIHGYVSGAQFVGGFAGYIGDSNLSKVSINAVINIPPSENESWNYSYVGTFSGNVWTLSLDNSYMVGTITNGTSLAGDSFGGLVGTANTMIATNTIVALKNFSDPYSVLTNTNGILGVDNGGNDFSTGVYFYTHANVFPETAFASVIQLGETEMKSQVSFPDLDFDDTWQMASEGAFKFPVFQSQNANAVFESGAYRAKGIGNIWIEETPKIDGHTIDPTLSSSEDFATLVFHNDSTSNIYIKNLALANNVSFTKATGINAGNCEVFMNANSPMFPGNTCTFGIKFDPNSTLATEIFRDMALVTVSVNGVEQVIAHGVDAIGNLDEALILDQSISLTDTIQGQTSMYDHYFSNDGTVNTTIVSFAFSGDSEITPDYTNCPVSTVLAPSSSCYVTFNFSPVLVQSYSGVLTVTYDDGYGSNKTALFNVTGNGIEHPFNNDPLTACQLADGTALKPFCIYDMEELDRMRNYSGLNFILTQDLDMVGSGCNSFEPIGNFSGTLDGQNHTLSNFCRNDANDRNVALFRATSGSVSNLNLQDFTIYGGDFVAAYAATVSGGTHDTINITNAQISKDRELGGSQNGGSGAGVFAASVYNGTVNNVNVQGTVAGGHNLGGFTGMIFGAGALIKNSSADVDVTYMGTATGFHCGGFVGFGIQGTIEDSTASGNVSVPSWATGGFVGLNAWANYTRNSASGTVTGSVNTGGFMGQDGDVTSVVTDCFATGNVIGNSTAGGFAGSFNSTASGSYATGNVSGTSYVGGFVGSTGGNISSSYASGTVTGTNYIGGFAGNNGGIINTSMSSKTTLTINGAYGGGFAGRNSGTINDSFSAVRSVVAVGDYAGGFVGYNTNIISRSYSLADMISSSTVFAPFIGFNDSGTFTNDYFNDDSGLGDTTATAVTSASMSISGNFVGFDFATPVWKMPTTNPNADYLSPVPSVLCGNAGIVCP